MVKKIVRTGLALLTVSSMFAMTAFAAEGDEVWNVNKGKSTVEGDAWTVDPIIEVELPGDLAFGINPLSLDADEDGTADEQIVSGDYLITNNSNVPVLVGTKTTLIGGDNVAILADAEYDDQSGDLKAVDGKKAIWMVQLFPTAPATISEEGNTLNVTDLTATDANADVKGKCIAGSTDDKAVNALFLLAANTGDTLKPECVSGFKFAGAVDPNATFEEADAIKVTTVFTLNTLSANQVANNYEVLDTGYDTTVVKEATSTP